MQFFFCFIILLLVFETGFDCDSTAAGLLSACFSSFGSSCFGCGFAACFTCEFCCRFLSADNKSSLLRNGRIIGPKRFGASVVVVVDVASLTCPAPSCPSSLPSS